MGSSKAPRVYYSLLSLCYLEIVLWSVCLLSSHHGSGYLERETGNLKAFTGVDRRCELVQEIAIAVASELEKSLSLEHASVQAQFNAAWSILAAGFQARASPLRAFPPIQGLPAPFTGIQAID